MTKSTTAPAPAVTPLGSFLSPRRRRVQTDASGVSATRQEFKNECDINRILSSFQRTGALDHFARYSGSYGDFTACDYQTAQNLIINARQMFDALPSKIRNLVSTPEGFLTFVQDPKNLDLMVEYGLCTRPSSSAPVSAVAEPKPASPSEGV